MMHALIDRDRIFERSPSPFTIEQFLDQKRSELIEAIAIQRLGRLLCERDPDPLSRDGGLLVSAILFGALIDHERWSEWLSASRGPIIDMMSAPMERDEPRLLAHGRAWVELKGGDGRPFRRWIADALTHSLMVHWQDNRRQKIESDIDVDDAIAAFLGWRDKGYDEKRKLHDGLYEAARLKWRLRMPGFLVQEIDRAGRCASLAPPIWNALLGRDIPNIRASLSQAKERRLPHLNSPKGSLLGELARALPSFRARPVERVRAGQSIAAMAERNDWKPIERHILNWAADRIDPTRDRDQRQAGLAPSTIMARASRLSKLLWSAFGDGDPRDFDAAGFAATLMASMTSETTTQNDRATLSCFCDWQQRQVGRLAVTWRGGYVRLPNPRNMIVTSSVYVALRTRFDPATDKGSMIRVMLMLGFRAGLRWSEVAALRVADVRKTCRHVELSVRNNDDRQLKTSASRRVVPLHLLLSDAEMAEFIDWWRLRSMAVPVASDIADGRRIFSKPYRLTHARLYAEIKRALIETTGGQVSTFHALRHSCASYLLATLALPFDVDDDRLALPIDPSLVSQERRRHVLSGLMGEAGTSLNAVHAVGALLGHSGDEATLSTYMHLHDWLAVIYADRASVQPICPTGMAAILLDRKIPAIERAHRRAIAGQTRSATERLRKRGRPSKGEQRPGGIMLSNLLERPKAQWQAANVAGHARPLPAPPPWQTLAALLAASNDIARRTVMDHPALRTTAGSKVAEHLLALIALSTRGRSGFARPRFVELPGHDRKRRIRRLNDREAARLGDFYAGLLSLAPREVRLVCDAFCRGYDRPRGVMRVPVANAEAIVDALRRAGCAASDIIVTDGPRVATIKVGADGRTDRGTVWAILFAAAVLRSGCYHGG